jgi:hypothetical protein
MPLTQISSRAIEDTLRYVLGASGTNHYTFKGAGLLNEVSDPTLTLSRGHTYIFENRNSNGAHPFYIKTSIANGGTNDQYSTGVTNNGGAGGTEIIFTVPHDAPDLLYYQCSSHINMAGQLKIAGAVADGSITTAKLADDAVTGDKLADDASNDANRAVNTNHIKDLAVETRCINNGAVTFNKLGNLSVGVSNIQPDSVDDTKLADHSTDNSLRAVGTNHIKDDAVTNAKIPSNAAIAGSKIDPNFGSQNVQTTGTVSDSKGNLRSIPNDTKTSAYTLVASDAGKCIRITTGGVTVPNSVFAEGDAVTIINQSGSDQTITAGSGFTLYNSGDGSAGNRTLAGRGMATMMFAASDAAYISGAGLS